MEKPEHGFESRYILSVASTYFNPLLKSYEIDYDYVHRSTWYVLA